MNLSNLPQLSTGVWLAIIAHLVLLAFLIGRSRRWAQHQVRLTTHALNSLNRFHQALLKDLSLKAVLEELTKAIAPGMGFQAARVYLLERDQRQLVGEGHSLSLEESPLPEALFSQTPWQGQGMILLPLADATPAGATEQCWQAPELRCTQTPKATLQNRNARCLDCENFAVLGMLWVSHFGRLPSEANRLREYADAAALAIKNARLYESQAQGRALAQQKANELNLIYEVSQDILRAQDERSILERLSQQLIKALGARRVRIALRNHSVVQLVLEHRDGLNTWFSGGAPADDNLEAVARSGLVQTQGNVITLPMLALPKGGPRIVGALEVTHQAQLDISLLTSVANQAGMALDNLSELERLRQREREASALAQLGHAFAAPFNRDPEGTLRLLCDAIRAYTGAASFITTIEVRSQVHTRVIASSFSAMLHYPPGEDNLTTAAMLSRSPVLTVNALESTQAQAEGTAFGAVAVLSLPLFSDERFVGALHAIKPDGFSSADVAKLERVAQQVALVLDNLELLRSVQLEGEHLESVLENLAEGVLILEGPGADSLSPDFVQNSIGSLGRANAVARSLLNLPTHFTVTQLPAQLRASLEQHSSNLTLGNQRFQVLVNRVSKHRSVVVLQDINAFETLERTKAQFLGVVSHELRTPLTAIIGFNELMLSGAAGTLSPEQQQFLSTTLTASQNLHQTVQNLLVASNLEAGLFELHPRMTYLNPKKSLERFKSIAAEKELSFQLELPEKQRLEVDAERISLVLENLVSNAVRYTPHGGEVRVRVQCSHDTLQAEVSNTGAGLEPEQEARLFQKFARDAQRSQEGAGIALYVSKAIVQAYGGRLWAENQPGKGLTMHLSIPLELQADAAALRNPAALREQN